MYSQNEFYTKNKNNTKMLFSSATLNLKSYYMSDVNLCTQTKIILMQVVAHS